MRTRTRIAVIFAGAAVVIAGREGAAAMARYRFGVNETTSLPNWAFIVDHENRQPGRGDTVEFLAPPNRYYPNDAPFIKHVYGVPGDVVSRRGREYFVNGRDVGYAKERSQAGFLTTLGPVGVIPPDHYFVGTPMKDSFDSRYGEIGWIPRARIVGVAASIL